MSQQRYIALLGGLNVGGHRVKMEHLRGLLRRLACSMSQPLSPGGNVIFETATDDVASLQTDIERHLTQELGYVVPTFIRWRKNSLTVPGIKRFQQEISTIRQARSGSCSFPRCSLSNCTRHFSGSEHTAVDRFHIREREIYWLCQGKITESLVNWRLLGKTDDSPRVTVRNVTTIKARREIRCLAARTCKTTRNTTPSTTAEDCAPAD